MGAGSGLDAAVANAAGCCSTGGTVFNENWYNSTTFVKVHVAAKTFWQVLTIPWQRYLGRQPQQLRYPNAE